MSSNNKQAPTNIRRFGSGKLADLTFTLDFHELGGGELLPNSPCLIRYDPLRIVHSDSYTHGDPSKPILLYYQFEANGPVSTQQLTSPAGIVEFAAVDPTGQGSMLTTQIDIPADAQELILWFSHTDENGETHYDSDYGQNFRFRFISMDIQIASTDVTSDPQTPFSGFNLTVAAIPAISEVRVRFTIFNNPDFPKTELALANTGQKDKTGKTIWSLTGCAVPYKCTVRFKIYYFIDGQRYKDDNNGQYFLSPVPVKPTVPANTILQS